MHSKHTTASRGSTNLNACKHNSTVGVGDQLVGGCVVELLVVVFCQLAGCWWFGWLVNGLISGLVGWLVGWLRVDFVGRL